MNTELLQFLGALITLAVLAFPLVESLAQGIAQRFHVRLPVNLDDTLTTTAGRVVSAAEQLSTVAKDAGGIAPGDRKQYALDAMKTILGHFGLKVDPDVLSTYIEAAVRILPKSGFTSVAGGFVSQPSPAMVGHDGPETIIPIPGATVTLTPPPSSTTSNPTVPGDTPTLTVAAVSTDPVSAT